MISKEEWDAAYHALIAEGPTRVGPPPTLEEVEALSRGQLQEPEAERVRALLAHYPDLLRVLTEPFPKHGEGVLTDEQLAADLAKIRERVRREHAPPNELRKKRSPPRALAIAAGIAIAIAIGSIAVHQMTHSRTVAMVVLYSDGERGGSIDQRGVPAQAPIQLSTATDYVLTLEPAFRSSRRYSRYRLELLDLSGVPPRRVWLLEEVQRQTDGTPRVSLSTDRLEPGLYRLILYGVNGTVERLAEYTLRLSAP